MELETGKFYLSANGFKIGPMVGLKGIFWVKKADRPSDPEWRRDGTNVRADGVTPEADLVAEWGKTPDIDLTKIDKPIGLLDPATQEALVTHDGPFQIYTLHEGWRFWNPLRTDGKRRPFPKDAVIRVKPQPLHGHKVTTLTVECDETGNRVDAILLNGRRFVPEPYPGKTGRSA